MIMTLQEITREKVLTEIIAERGSMILSLCKENEKLKAQVRDTEKAAEKNKELEAKVKSLTVEKTEE